MRYAQIRKMDISNGEGIGAALFVQGCHFHCKNCFNQDTWDFEGGYEWTDKIRDSFIKLTASPYVKRISILGGEPLCEENCKTISSLCKEIKTKFPNKSIWIYSGYTWEELIKRNCCKNMLQYCDVLVDGRYIDELKDVNYPWAGSTNQRIIDVHESLRYNEIVLYQSK